MMRRDQSIIALRAMGLTVKQIAARLKLSDRAVYMALRRVQPAQTVIVDELKRDPVNTEMLHTRLSDMFNADIIDAIEGRRIHAKECPLQRIEFHCECPANPNAGRYRQLDEWPPILRRMLTGRDIEEMNDYSTDGETTANQKHGT